VIVAVPADTAETTPALLTVATAALLLLQAPPEIELLRLAVEPAHKIAEPLIADGAVLTVIVFVTIQLVPVEYVIVALPALTPLTMPLTTSTVATDVLLLLHVPPVDVLVSAIVEPAQTVLLPPIAAGAAFTVTPLVV
jgi:hypothetical protein